LLAAFTFVDMKFSPYVIDKEFEIRVSN
jgi:hypothetical protein